MRRPRTDFTGWTAEQIREHKNQRERERWAENPEKGRNRGRRYYAAHKDEIIQRQKVSFDEKRERRREIVRRSRHKNPMRILLESAERRAREQNLPFTLTKEWGAKAYKGRCELTGIEFTTRGRFTGSVSPFAPSLDQIIPGRGYTPDNTQIILWALNRFKNNWPWETIMMIARALVTKIDAKKRG